MFDEFIDKYIAGEIDKEVEEGASNYPFSSIVIRQVFASTIATELVSVQPLSAPIGQLHYFDFNIDITPNRVKFFNRDEFYAYDDIMKEYLGKEHYPSIFSNVDEMICENIIL